MIELRILTFNTWSLPFGLSKNKRWRLQKIAHAIKALNPYVVFLQECWLSADVQKIASILEGYSCTHSQRIFNYGGLAVFCKQPIAEQKQYYFKTNTQYSAMEILARKGYIIVTTNSPVPLVFVSTHFYSGCTKKMRFMQKKQLNELLQMITNIPSNTCTIIGGDFNMPPHLLTKYSNQQLTSLTQSNQCTFDKKNKYTQKRGNWLAQPQYQKLDFFATRKENRKHIIVVDEQIVFTQPPLSDHYGVLLKIQVR